MNDNMEILKQVAAASFTEKETIYLLDILSKKLSIDESLHFYEIALKQNLLQFAELNRDLSNDIVAFNIDIRGKTHLITSLPYFDKALDKNGAPVHENARKAKEKWFKVLEKYNETFDESYFEINPKAKDVLKRLGWKAK